MRCPTCQSDNTDDAEVCFSCGQRLGAPPIVRGSMIGGRYEVVDLLGKGGMGLVYKARDRTLGDEVAIKLLRTDVARSAEVARRFKTEIKLARKIRHKNVCGIHEYGEEGALRFIAMEFVDGTDLRQHMKRHGAFPAEEALDISIQVARGLEAIHEAGIIHRDLKTSNIMRDSRGVIRLMDFGIAKQAEGDTNATATGVIIGTPEYMSPEQARGEKVDFRSDLYSLGIIVFELFTGEVPFRGDTPLATVLKHLQEPPPLTGGRADRIPPAVTAILRLALEKDRANRPADASTFGRLLEATRGHMGLRPATSLRQSAGAALAEPLAATESMRTPVPTAVPTLAPTQLSAPQRRPPPTPAPRRVPSPRSWVPVVAGLAGVGAMGLFVLAGVLYWRGDLLLSARALTPGGNDDAAVRGTTEDITQDLAVAPVPTSLPPPADAAAGVDLPRHAEIDTPATRPTQASAPPEARHQPPPPAMARRDQEPDSVARPTKARSTTGTTAGPPPASTSPRTNDARAGNSLTLTTSPPAGDRAAAPSPPPQSSAPVEAAGPAVMTTAGTAVAAPATLDKAQESRAPGATSPAEERPAPTSRPVATVAITEAPAPPTTEPAGMAILVIEVKPEAEIQVNGSVIGTMSLYTVPLKAGRHELTFVHSKYQPLSRVIYLSADQRKRLFVDLKDEAVPRK